jgi:phospholipid N-methyltransferase
MKDQPGEFYNDWSIWQLANSDRTRILKWKAANLANLFLRSIKDSTIKSICEIGGAEGIVLDSIGHLLNAKELINFDISTAFCHSGAEKFPHITFLNQEFPNPDREYYDLIVCSDVIEHIDDDSIFLETVSQNCRYSLLKIPIEKCLINSKLWYRLLGQKKPVKFEYGPQHYNGHLRGYSIHEAIKVAQRDFVILDKQVSDVVHFYGGKRQNWISKYLGEYISTWLFGGAMFLLGESRHFKSDKG